MKRLNIFLLICYFFGLIVLTGCKKFLDTKSDQSMAIPSTIADLQAILDRYINMNNADPGSAEVSADNFYLTDADWSTLSEAERRLYMWENDFVFPNYPNDWSRLYNTVYSANVVLDNLSNITRNGNNRVEWDNVRGSALLYRAKALSQAVFIWTNAYTSTTAKTMLGIPLRTTEDYNVPTHRATLEESYIQIISDLKEAVDRLPVTPVHVMRPSKPAAYGLLARIYLSMGNYDSCLLYADNCLKLKNTLLNYNLLNPNASFPISQLNSEVIMENLIGVPSSLSQAKGKIDSTLYSSYNSNDLRKVIYFKSNSNGTYSFKGSYEGGGNLFSGVAVDEIYLMRAESNAKLGNISSAVSDINTLLQNRWKTGTYVPLVNPTADILIKIVRDERRKELLMRGLRWMDLKRLNVEGENIILTRVINGQSYTLSPKDLRYAIAIPEEIIRLSGIEQNPR